jgi:hypothetical protein
MSEEKPIENEIVVETKPIEPEITYQPTPPIADENLEKYGKSPLEEIVEIVDSSIRSGASDFNVDSKEVAEAVGRTVADYVWLNA